MKCRDKTLIYKTREEAEVGLQRVRKKHGELAGNLAPYQCWECNHWHLGHSRDRKKRFRLKLVTQVPRAGMPKTLLGVVLGWSRRPEHFWRWEDGYEGILQWYRRDCPEHFATDGWPLDPETRARLEVYVEPAAAHAMTPLQTRFKEGVRIFWSGLPGKIKGLFQ